MTNEVNRTTLMGCIDQSGILVTLFSSIKIKINFVEIKLNA